MEQDNYEEIRNAKYTENDPILVSVAMIAYNVGLYLTEAIESVLSQKINFKIELVIGEDCSTDNTRELALKYQKKYPEIIIVLLPERNQGLTLNSVVTQNACRGKYIALLDGDDFWTENYKLQKQIDFLENHDTFSACAHQSYKIYGENFIEKSLFGENVNKVYGLLDTIRHRKFHTSSLVYRKAIWDKVGDIPTNISSNERAIYPMLAIFGNIMYFKDAMCVYRLSPTGLNSRITAKELETDLNMIPFLKRIDRTFPFYNFRSFLHLCIFTYPKKVPFKLLLKHYFFFLFFSFSYFPKNIGDIKYATKEAINKIKQLFKHKNEE